MTCEAPEAIESLNDLHAKVDLLLSRAGKRVRLNDGEQLRRVNPPVGPAAEAWPRCLTLQTDEDRVFVLRIHRDGRLEIDGPVS